MIAKSAPLLKKNPAISTVPFSQLTANEVIPESAFSLMPHFCSVMRNRAVSSGKGAMRKRGDRPLKTHWPVLAPLGLRGLSRTIASRNARLGWCI